MAASKSARPRKPAAGNRADPTPERPLGDGLSGLAEQLARRILRPLGLVVLSRERIQEALDEAAERGRLTRTDANELVVELIGRGRQQLDELVLGADWAKRSKRSKRVGSSFPISDYDEMTIAQVQKRLKELTPPQLRRVRDYERRHANRKSLLGAIEKAL